MRHHLISMETVSLDNKTLWENALAEIEVSVSKANFATWFKDTLIVRINDGVAVVGVPNAFVKDWLSNKYSKAILKSLRDQSDEIKSVDFTVANIEKAKLQQSKQRKVQEKKSQELPLADYYLSLIHI